MERKNIMIIGGEFYNKGAQAMSFITISRLKTQYPNHNILFISEMDSRRPASELEQYNFDIITNPFTRNNFPGENLVRKALGRSKRTNPKGVKHLLKNTEILFDISGYALSSQWGEEKSARYLERLEIAKSHGIKTVILPQSIGPFNYENNEFLPILSETLNNVDIIMPRERQGEEDLHKIGVVDNVKRIPDIVLTNTEPINWEHIYKRSVQEKEFNISSNSIGIIPNMHNFKHGNKDEVLNLYKETIEFLRSKNKNIVLTRHSHEDIEACNLIKEMFPNDDNVKIIADDMTPAEFEKLVQQFDFTIGSRFHSVIHSYKVGVPCLVLGWATKYVELAELFNQDDYVFDVRENFEVKTFLDKVSKISANAKDESKKILNELEVVKGFGDPFDYAFNTINSVD